MSEIVEINYLFIFLLGACLGSFANVIILRYPNGQSLLPRSSCTSCGSPVPWYHNIPLISYFVLRGRCHSCKSPFSVRYVFVEYLMALLFLATYFYYGHQIMTIEYLILIFGLVVASFIDLDHMILPDVITFTGMALGLVGGLLNPERSFWDSLAGFAFGGGVLWLVAYVYYVFTGREGLGGGDIKLLAWLGSLLGWKSIPFIILVSSVLGSVVGLTLSFKNTDKGQSKLQTMIPFGPFIAVAAVMYLLGLKSVGSWYIDLFFPTLE